MATLYSKTALEVTVFVCGALVMVFEIIGSRILSPFIGQSTYIWTSLIGVILASLSAGYWVGGRLADKRPDARILGTAIFLAGALVAVTVLIKDVFLSILASAAMPLEAKSVIAALVLFAPASVCLGIVTPFAVRLRMSSIETTGQTVGRLYALSTIGSIGGTFAAGFLLIPFVGSVRTLYLIAAMLFGLAFVVAPIRFSAPVISGFLVLILGISASEANSGIAARANGLVDYDTEYSRIQLFRTTDPESGRPIKAIATDPYFVQSAQFLDSEETVLPYARFYHLVRALVPSHKRTLMIGGAAYTFPMEFLRTYPRAHLNVIEIDPRMTQIARDQFGMKDNERMRIFHEDGRMFLNRNAGAGYDAILMDAFGSLFSVPYHLTTIEAVTAMSRAMNDDGVVIFNLGGSLEGRASGFLRAELATYKAVFQSVYLFKVNPAYEDTRLQNLILVASKRRDALPRASEDPEIERLLGHQYNGSIASADILTDDLAPVEYYNSIAQSVYLSSR